MFCLYIICFVTQFRYEIPNNYNDSIFVDSKSVNSGYLIFVDIEICKLAVFKNKQLYKQYPCSGGKLSTPSPIGTWTIIDKGRWGEGFGGGWLGFNVPWGRFGIHGTVYPQYIGSNASKGCIRMYNKDIADLYSYVPCGTKVIIVDGCYGPFGRGLRTLKPGMYGADVMEIQKKLKSMGLFHGHTNGKYESSLQHAIHEFQKKNKLRIDNNIYLATIKLIGFNVWE